MSEDCEVEEGPGRDRPLAPAEPAEPAKLAAAGPDGPSAADAAAAAKEAGNTALKSADLPLAIEHYEEAVKLFEDALAVAPQPEVLRNNDVVRYGSGSFAVVDTAHPHFGDYVLQDLGTRNIVKIKVGKYEEVSKRFLRKELTLVPQHLFNLRLACLQNLALVSLKLARGSQRSSDFQEAVKRADVALSMDGRAAKALMRKGAALIELKDTNGAAKVLTLAAQETRGRDPEVARLLELVLAAKGKGKGRGAGRGRGAAPTMPPPPPADGASDDSDEGEEAAALPKPQSPCDHSADAGAATAASAAPASSEAPTSCDDKASSTAATTEPPLPIDSQAPLLRLWRIVVAMVTIAVAVFGTSVLMRGRLSESAEQEVEL